LLLILQLLQLLQQGTDNTINLEQAHGLHDQGSAKVNLDVERQSPPLGGGTH
jgi:hypothetical protein